MEEYDVIIVGGGCAGFPAAVYAARFNLNALVIAKELGGLITSTHVVENYPGFISLSGQELATKLEEHVKANNVPIENDIVQSVQRDGDSFLVKTELMEKTYKTKTVILATGTRHKHLDVKVKKNCKEREFLTVLLVMGLCSKIRLWQLLVVRTVQQRKRWFCLGMQVRCTCW